MKEDTGQSRREVTLPLVMFDPSKSFGSAFDLPHQSFNSRRGANVSCSRLSNNRNKKSARDCSLHKKVSF